MDVIARASRDGVGSRMTLVNASHNLDMETLRYVAGNNVLEWVEAIGNCDLIYRRFLARRWGEDLEAVGGVSRGGSYWSGNKRCG